MDMLKIKEMFPNFPNKKVQKVINSDNGKPEPRINMTTKSPSYKQVIVLINNELAKRFFKDSSMHVININCALKNILSNTIADFICAKDKGIIITTNNVSLSSNLQEIKKICKKFSYYWCRTDFIPKTPAIQVLPKNCRHPLYQWKNKHMNFIWWNQEHSKKQSCIQ